MRAVYDLKVSPPTFDFLKFLVQAAMWRDKHHPQERIDLYIVPGPRGGFRDDPLPPDIEMRRRMLVQVVFSSCLLMRDVRPILCAARKEGPDTAHFPECYRASQPSSSYQLMPIVKAHEQGERVESLKAPDAGLRIADMILKGRTNVVPLVLREAAYWPARNSDMAEWFRFASFLDDEGYVPLFVRDAANQYKPIEVYGSGVGWETCPLATGDVLVLSALLERAPMSFFVNGGTALLAQLNHHVRFCVSKMIVPSCPSATEGFFKGAGYTIGKDFPGHTDNVIVWGHDYFERLVGAYHEFEKRDAEPMLKGMR